MEEAEGSRSRSSFARLHMLSSLAREVRHVRTIRAIMKVPREEFVQPDLRPNAYSDTPLPIGRGQTISQPLMVALMTAALDPQPEDRLMEIGAGSGYQAALLGELAAHVDTVERFPELAGTAAARLTTLGYHNIEVHIAKPDVLGWPQGAPYNGIMVTAGAPSVPDALIAQLAVGGHMVIPVGGQDEQQLLFITKTEDGYISEERGLCRFVPLRGPGGWPNG